MAKSSGRGRQRTQEQQAARREARQEERKREQAAKIERERAARRKRTLVQIGTAVGVVAVLALIATYFVVRESSSDITAEGPPRTDDEGAVVTGPDDAPVTVEVISDFGCPACATFDLQVGAAIDTFVEQGDVQLRYRVVSALDRVSPNEFSSRAAAAGGCVLDQDDPEVWSQFKTAVFGSQPTEQDAGPSDTELIGLATQAGADEAEVTACIDNGDRAEWAEAVDSVAAGDYTSTPDVIVNDERVLEPTAANVQSAITSALAGS